MGKLKSHFFLRIKRLLKEEIISVFSFTAVATIIKMLTGLIGVKVVASIIGPSGIALLGQLNNFSSIIMTIACGGINTGITKYVAEYKAEEHKIKSLLSTALIITIYCSLFVGIGMIIFHHFLGRTIMFSSNYGYVFIIFGFTVCLYALNSMLLSILNGYKEFKKYVHVNIVSSIIGLIFTLSFVFTLGLRGALVSAITFQSSMFFVTLWMVRKSPWVSWVFFSNKIDKDIVKKYFHYTVMALVTTITIPISQMILRGYVISEISSIEAGWWESMNRISSMYLMVITSSFGVYYLPKLSELKVKSELRHEIFKAYKIIIPILIIGFFIIYFSRYLIIKLLFTEDFLPMESLFVWQLLGDFFKIVSWILAFLMIAKSMTRLFITTEVFFSLFYLILGFVFVKLNGIVGITQAYMLNYVVYTIMMFITLKKIIF